jgi:membrane protease YdiL (CAAX protease family)
MTICFATSITKSFLLVILHQDTVLTDGRLYYTASYEIAAMAVAGTLLRYRGWRFKDIATDRLDAGGIAIGFGAALAIVVALTIASTVLQGIAGDWKAGPAIAVQAAPLHLTPIIFVSVVNPVFEEFFVCGYVITALERGGGRYWTGVHVSVGVRLAYHLYQGASGVVTIVPMGIVFAVWYLKTRRFWPLVAAHTALDFFPFLSRTMW